MKQGHWIKKYPGGRIQYEAYFKDNHPAGELKRYSENGNIKSVMNFSPDGREAVATFYYPDGRIASKGKYINQQREGEWQFFAQDSSYLISEDTYVKNRRNGPSLKYYPDGKIAEEVNFVNDLKNGEWIQYYQNGHKWIQSAYQNGRLNGKFEVWFENGTPEITGEYMNDSKEGTWLIYNNDGSLRYKIEYKNGYTTDRQMDIDQSNFIDSLEKNKDKIADPEKTGEMW
jgi:antitoxin component YwqK of YwqJK toxin-antitoxin module